MLRPVGKVEVAEANVNVTVDAGGESRYELAV